MKTLLQINILKLPDQDNEIKQQLQTIVDYYTPLIGKIKKNTVAKQLSSLIKELPSHQRKITFIINHKLILIKDNERGIFQVNLFFND